MVGDRTQLLSRASQAADDSGPWDVVTLGDANQLSASLFNVLLNGSVAAIRVPGFLPPDKCVLLLERLRQVGIGTYTGMRHALGMLWPNHWVPRYVTGDWDAYFDRRSGVEDQKRQVFEPIGDPRRLVNDPISRALGTPITPLRRPGTGRVFHAMIVRTGAAELHFDWAGFDLMPEVAHRVRAQMAWNIYLANPGDGGDLQVFQQLGTTPGMTKSEAAARTASRSASRGAEVVFGNYGFPLSVLDQSHLLRSASIPVAQGDLVFLMNRHFHRVGEITPREATHERVAISAHLVRLDDGSWHDFN